MTTIGDLRNFLKNIPNDEYHNNLKILSNTERHREFFYKEVHDIELAFVIERYTKGELKDLINVVSNDDSSDEDNNEREKVLLFN